MESLCDVFNSGVTIIMEWGRVNITCIWSMICRVNASMDETRRMDTSKYLLLWTSRVVGAHACASRATRNFTLHMTVIQVHACIPEQARGRTQHAVGLLKYAN